MIEFQTLGALDLRKASGERVGSVLAHPKRVGLLLHLVLDQPGRPVERALLAGRFWPESTDQRAAASFRNALSRLRRSLGPEVIESDAQQVRIRPDALTCDALELLDAVEGGRWMEAVERATGALAPGFHLDGLPEFERWLEAERERVRRAALRAFRAAAAEQADEHPRDAERLLARGALFAPFDEALVTERMQLLDRCGDRPAAVRLYRSWAEDLRAHLDLDPSPAVSALHDRIASTSGAPSPTVPAPVEPPAAYVRAAATPEAAHRDMPEPGRPAPSIGARRAVPWAAVVAIGAALAWLGAAGFGSATLQDESAATVEGPPPSPPPEARALVDSGMVRYGRSDLQGAVDAFRSAARLAPRFPAAQYGLALAARGAGMSALASQADRALRDARPWLTPGERARADALAASPDSARDLYEALMRAEPDSLDVVLQLADLEFHWGSFWGVPHRDVRARFERLERAGYAPVPTQQHLLRLDGAAADLDGVRRRLAVLDSLGAPHAELLTGRALVAVLDPGTSLDVVEEVADLPAAQANVVLGAVASVPVQPDRVDRFFERIYDLAPPARRAELGVWNALAAVGRGRVRRAAEWLQRVEETAPARADEFRAVVATLPWLPPDAARLQDAARRLGARRSSRLISPFSSDFSADAIYAPRAVFLKYLTELPSLDAPARAVFDTLTQRNVLDLALTDAYRRILEARDLLFAHQDDEAALQVLGPPRIPPDGLRPDLLHHPFAVARYLRARALALGGQVDRAARFIDAWPDPRGYDRAYLTWSLVFRADRAAELGRTADALRDYRRADALLAGADPAFGVFREHIAVQVAWLEAGGP